MANLVTPDEWLHRKILGDAMVEMAHLDDKSTPPEVMQEIFRRTAKTLGDPDPYQEEKRRWRAEMLANQDGIRSRINDAEDSFAYALKASIAANFVDDELRDGTTLKALLSDIESATLPAETVAEFRASVKRAESIVMIHDSVGELFFDRLLLEQIAKEAGEGCRMLSAVRTTHVLGDATREDAEAIGLGEVVAEIVDPGLECLGVPLSECSNEFREIIQATDLVIAKGQASYQSLEAEGRRPDGTEKEVWFLFRVKCPVMARQLAVDIGGLFLERN